MSASNPNSVVSNKIWIGNLDPKVTEYQLMKIVEPFGAIASFDFLYTVHPQSGARTPKGYAFVTYSSAASAQKALRHLSTASGGKALLLHGRPIAVRPATSNKASNGSSLTGLGRKRPMPSALSVPSSSSTLSKEDKIKAMEAKLKAMQQQSSDQFKLAIPGASKQSSEVIPSKRKK